MQPGFPERDWKVFRELREVALDRLFQRALRDAKAVIEDPSKTPEERFRELYALVAERDDRIARGFDGSKRSVMIFQLSYLHGLGLLEADEMARFSEGTRERVEALAKLG